MATPRSWAGPLWARARIVAERTPASRDRVIDLLRALSLSVVVLGHLLMALVIWRHGVPHLDNLLAHVPALRLATWVFQVMPIFFFAGALASAISWRRASARSVTWAAWAYGRLARLVRPVAIYLALWIPFVLIIQATLGSKVGAPLAALSTQLLWFLGVYIPATVATPWLLAATARARWGTPLAMLGVAAVCDIVRLGAHVPILGVVNFVVVWIMAAQLGLTFTAAKPPTSKLVLIILVGLIANAALIIHGPWPVSMVGLPGDKFSNMAPPTVVLAVHCWVLASAVTLAWPVFTRLAQHARVWTYTVAIGGTAITLYLWHLTALVALVVAERELGIDRGVAVGTLSFWGLTVIHVALALVLTWCLVTVFGPFEHRKLPWLDSPRSGRGHPVSCAIGILLTAASFLVLSTTGMAGFPFSRVTRYAGLPLTPGIGFALLLLGVALARAGSGGGGARLLADRA